MEAGDRDEKPGINICGFLSKIVFNRAHAQAVTAVPPT